MMKMEGVSDLVNGRSEVLKPREVTKVPQPSPKEIGREFVRQYYTMLSERPQDVYRFYSHESYFIHDTDPPVQGQQKIQRAIERLNLVDCKARIFTVNGTATVSNGLVIQVCGELTVADSVNRRFLQTFILCPQTPKKYYVHNDVFQWLDRAFNDSVPEQQSHDNTSVDSSSKEDSPGAVNGEQIPAINGQLHNTISLVDEEQRATDVSDEAINVSEEEHEDLEPTDEHESYVTQAEDEHQRSFEKQNEITEEKPAAASVEQEQAAVSGQQTSWAKMVSSSVAAAPAQTVQSYARVPASSQSVSRPTAPQPQPVLSSVPAGPTNIGTYHQKDVDTNTSGRNVQMGTRFASGDNSCRLHIGNIIRKITPEKTEIAENEIKAAFEKYGPVGSVKVPPKALDKNRAYNAYAFIIMKTPEGAENAFKASRKDPEREQHLLHLKLDSFNFDGEVALSEQFVQGKRASFLSRSGPAMQGMTQGGYARGGGFYQRGVRASFGGQKQFGGGGEQRYAGNVRSQQHE